MLKRFHQHLRERGLNPAAGQSRLLWRIGSIYRGLLDPGRVCTALVRTVKFFSLFGVRTRSAKLSPLNFSYQCLPCIVTKMQTKLCTVESALHSLGLRALARQVEK